MTYDVVNIETGEVMISTVNKDFAYRTAKKLGSWIVNVETANDRTTLFIQE